MQGFGSSRAGQLGTRKGGRGEGQASPTGAVSALPCPPVMGTIWGQKRLIQDGVRHSSSASLAAAILSPLAAISPFQAWSHCPPRMFDPHSSCNLQQPTAFLSLEAELQLPAPPTARLPARSCNKERRAA